jgi:hypothetical protein
METSLVGQFVPRLKEWLDAHEGLVWWAGISSVVVFLGTLVVLIFVIVVLPSNYFVRHDENHPTPIESPVLRVFYQVFKNVIGGVFILAGLAMLVLPGQGLVSLVIGLSLTGFPGKRRLIRAIIRRKAVFRSANWLRAACNRPPLQSP